MRVRECVPSKWAETLKGTALEPAVPHLDSCGGRVAIVTDDAGKVIGTWALVSLLHAEGVWIDPAHQGKAGVARLLWRQMQAFVREHGASSVLTGANTPEVAQLLERHGAHKIEATTYTLPMEKLCQ
jgi:EAL domain-containing protein (putative c-di-GMP-specific phosphodiesterase class I)